MLLPTGEDFVEGGADLLPLRLCRVLRGELLGLDHEHFPLGESCLRGRFRLRILLFGELTNGSVESVESLDEGGQVSNGIGRGDRDFEHGDGLCDICRCRSSRDALLEQCHLACELDVLALEIAESFFGSAVGILPHRAPALAVAHEDGAGFVNTAPWSLIVCRQKSHLCLSAML